jgi:serine/threonine protein kinase
MEAEIRLIDFEFASPFSEEPWGIVSALQYTPPELLTGCGKGDGAVDVWALGVSLYGECEMFFIIIIIKSLIQLCRNCVWPVTT